MAQILTSSRWRKIFITVCGIWLALSVVGFTAMTVADFQWTNIYFYMLFFCIGMPMWFLRARLRKKLLAWNANSYVKIIVLLFGMVLLEEIFAGLFNHLTEGFDFALLLKRILQFWAFNIFAFAGPIFVSAILSMRVRYSFVDMLAIAGLWGLYAEKVIFTIATSQIYFFCLAPLVFVIYGIIFAPAYMSVNAPEKRHEIILPLRYAMALALFYLGSIPFVGTLIVLRQKYPDLFPPPEFISL